MEKKAETTHQLAVSVDDYELEVEPLAFPQSRGRDLIELALPVVSLAPLEGRGRVGVPTPQGGVLPDGAEVGAEGNLVRDGDGDVSGGGGGRGRRGSEDCRKRYFGERDVIVQPRAVRVCELLDVFLLFCPRRLEGGVQGTLLKARRNIRTGKKTYLGRREKTGRRRRLTETARAWASSATSACTFSPSRQRSERPKEPSPRRRDQGPWRTA